MPEPSMERCAALICLMLARRYPSLSAFNGPRTTGPGKLLGGPNPLGRRTGIIWAMVPLPDQMTRAQRRYDLIMTV